MKLGIYTQEIMRPTIFEVFEAIKEYGLNEVQFNMISACGIEMPADISENLINEINEAKRKTGLSFIAINGTYNMINPDLKKREEGLKAFNSIASICTNIDCNSITLCTGTRNIRSMWLPHPQNETKEAWNDLCNSMEKVLTIAEEKNLKLGIEIENSNIINTPEKALKIINEMQTDKLFVIMDCANLFKPNKARVENVQEVMKHAFDVVGDYVELAHGKDIAENADISFVAPGKGIIDFCFFKKLLDTIGYKGSMILHGFHSESEIKDSISYLKNLE